VISERGLQIWIERHWGQTTAGVIYGYSAFGKNNQKGNYYEILNPLNRKINLNYI
jgi:hypothetical protein